MSNVKISELPVLNYKGTDSVEIVNYGGTTYQTSARANATSKTFTATINDGLTMTVGGVAAAGITVNVAQAGDCLARAFLTAGVGQCVITNNTGSRQTVSFSTPWSGTGGISSISNPVTESTTTQDSVQRPFAFRAYENNIIVVRTNANGQPVNVQLENGESFTAVYGLSGDLLLVQTYPYQFKSILD